MPDVDAFPGHIACSSLSRSEIVVSAEFVIPYPPGIPIISPGEVITKEVLDNAYVLYKSGVEITGVKNQTLEKFSVLR